MQKIMICLARPESSPQGEWNTRVSDLMNDQLEGIRASSYAIVDQDVAPAHLLVMHNTPHPKDALLTIWTDNPFSLEPILKQVAQLGLYQAYAVSESAAIAHHPKPGRVEGMCQVALIKKPEAMSRQDWQRTWLGDHTQIAIDTQSTFAYRQNVIAFSLPLGLDTKSDWPLMDAIVEENFPALAMTSREAFFAAEGDSEKFERHQQIMMQSCFRFIDFDAFDCTPMSQYVTPPPKETRK